VRLIIVRTIVVIVPFIVSFVLDAVSLLALGFTILKPDQKPVLIGFDENLKTVISVQISNFKFQGETRNRAIFSIYQAIF
jgi:hypothetical protein